MMGMPMPPEMQAKIDEQVRQRKEKVAASLGKTLEEFDQEQHCYGHDHAHEAEEHACAAAEHNHDDHAHDSSKTTDPASDVPEVDEKAVPSSRSSAAAFVHSKPRYGTWRARRPSRRRSVPPCATPSQRCVPRQRRTKRRLSPIGLIKRAFYLRRCNDEAP